MSTIPGDSSWADAGLVPPDSSRVQDPSRSTTPVVPDDQPRAPRPVLRDEAEVGAEVSEGDAADDYEPADARPDLDFEAAEQDVVEEYEPDTPRPDVRGEAHEADVVEQAQEVPVGDDDYPLE